MGKGNNNMLELTNGSCFNVFQNKNMLKNLPQIALFLGACAVTYVSSDAQPAAAAQRKFFFQVFYLIFLHAVTPLCEVFTRFLQLIPVF